MSYHIIDISTTGASLSVKDDQLVSKNPDWQLFLLNRDGLLSQMDLFLKRFTELRDAVAVGDADRMKEMMRLSTERRSYFDK